MFLKLNHIFFSPDEGTGSATGDVPATAPASGGNAPGAPSAAPPSSGSPAFPSVKLGGNGAADPNASAAPKLGADGKPLPAAAADPNAKPEGNAFHGAPPEGQDYAMPTLGEGQELDTALIDSAKPLLKELGLSQAGFQKLAEWYATEVAGKQNAAFVDQVAQWEKDARADKELGGDKFDGHVASAQKALGAFGTAELSKLLLTHGLGNHPEVIRVFARIGASIVGEDNADGKPAGGNTKPVDYRDVFYGPEKK